MIGAARWLVDRWERFWFAPEDACNLAMARVLVGMHALWFLLSRDYAGLSSVPAEFWGSESHAVRWRYLIFPGHPAAEHMIQGLALLALVGVLAGVFPRVCCLVAGAALYHLAPMEVAFWTSAPTSRGLTLAALSLPVLACSRCADALVILPKPRDRSTAPAWEYGWPLRFVQLSLCLIYLFSAYGKLVRTGIGWGSADSVRRWLLWFNLEERSSLFQAPGLWLADRPGLCLLIGVATLLFELGFMTVLFSRTARRWLIPAAFAFHVGILVTMSIHVPETWLLLVFVNWAWLWSRFRPARGGVLAPTAAAS